MPSSNMKVAIAQVLRDEGFVKGYQVLEVDDQLAVEQQGRSAVAEAQPGGLDEPAPQALAFGAVDGGDAGPEDRGDMDHSDPRKASRTATAERPRLMT